MKKSTSLILTVLFVLSLFFTGCSTDPIEIDPFADIPETPAEMFEYEDNENGGITITWYKGTDEIVNIPNQINSKNITKIGYAAFIKNTTLISVKIPDTITNIDSNAFEGCESLATVILPKYLNTIDKFAFRNCKALNEIHIPNSVTDIYMEAFLYSGLESLTLGTGLTQIRENVFGGTNIKTIDIPPNIQTISYGAFGGCSQLETVILHDGLQTIESNAFAGESKLQEIIIPKTVTSIDQTAFTNCYSLKSLKFEGDAPEAFILTTEFDPIDVPYIVYYHKDAKGFDTSEWDTIPTSIW